MDVSALLQSALAQLGPLTSGPPSARLVESQQIYFTCRQMLPRNDIDPFGDTPPLRRRRDDEPSLEGQVLHALPQPGKRTGIERSPELDLDRKNPLAVDDQEVHLGARLGSPEEKLWPV